MAQSEEGPKSPRDVRIIQLKTRGLTDAATSAQLKKEMYLKCSLHTVSRVWVEIRREKTDLIVDELQRQQMADITLEDNRAVKMKYRDRLLDKLMPRQPLPVALEGGSLVVHFDRGLQDNGPGDSRAEP